MDQRHLARMIAVGRLAVGTALVVAPARAGAAWIGPAATDPAVRVALRALGVRDAALGAGTLRALDQGTPVGPWVQAGATSDAVDLVASVLAVRAIGLRRTLAVAAVAGTAAVIGGRAAPALD